ncbi:hypothetical protein [Halalkalicoccus ordinarius]|uniref:hypothetical protein n=1 Tax=Halalkalicoccus ordinarius TaxID=3116651 RepID=UPI00300F56B9
MIRNGYPRLWPPHDWIRQTEGELPTRTGVVVLAQWISEHRDTITIYQHDPPEGKRKRFSVVWEPTDDAATVTIWGSSIEVTAAHVQRTFERARVRGPGDAAR